MIVQICNQFFNEQTINDIYHFVWEVSSRFWAIGGTLFLLYYFFKDSFASKIIVEIQDEELKKLTVLHKELFRDIVSLQSTLLYNINLFLETPKEDGIIWRLQMSISENFSDFEYDIAEHSFKKIANPNFHNYHLGPTTYGYESISYIMNAMKMRIKEFEKTTPFYYTSAINKYISGTQSFGIVNFILHNNENSLLCEEFFKTLCENMDSINFSERSDENKIKELNKALDMKNDNAIYTALHTIECAINIETYIHRFSKAFGLKKRRDRIPFIQILDFYKK